MFDMNFTGNRIAEARRKNDLTQMELAELLGVSYQAVSSWERGNTMPDISRLPEIAEALGVSVDFLLGGESKVAEGVINGDLSEKVESGEVSVDEVVEAVPVIKPSEIDGLAENLMGGENENAPSLTDFARLFCFLGDDAKEKLFRAALKRGDFEGIRKIAPFLNDGLINGAAREIYERFGIEGIRKIAPFLEKETIDGLAREIYDNSGIEAIRKIAPFIGNEKLHEIAKLEARKNGVNSINPIASFLDADFIGELLTEMYR